MDKAEIIRRLKVAMDVDAPMSFVKVVDNLHNLIRDLEAEQEPKPKPKRLELENMTWEYDEEKKTWKVTVPHIYVEEFHDYYLSRTAILILLKWLVKECDHHLPILFPGCILDYESARHGLDLWRSDG